MTPHRNAVVVATGHGGAAQRASVAPAEISNIGPGIRTDPNTRDMRTITLSYTMFREAANPSAEATLSSLQPAMN
ncbi:MAG: hypothetical protein ACREFB_01590 [Stellaceae bacterium]